MIDVVSVDNMRRSDKYTIDNYISARELMYRAGLGVYNLVQWRPPVLVVCGSGNNAGDGFVIAKLLKDSNIDCTLLCLSDKMSSEGANYYEACRSLGVKTLFFDSEDEEYLLPRTLFDEANELSLKSYATIVDCIFGTGFHGKVNGHIARVISAINNSGSYVVSVDINSGLNGDSGMTEQCVVSDLTVSIGAYKPGHFLNMAKDVIKKRANTDIGIKPIDAPYGLVEGADVAAIFPKRKNFSNKGSYGYIALIGGSLNYNGAIRLAYMANAAMRAGAGVVRAAAPKSICREMIPHILESTLFPLSDKNGNVVFIREELDALIRNVKTVAFGMGIGVSDESRKILEYLLTEYKGTLIVDADGLTILSGLDKDIIRNAVCRIVLTPHIKEFSRLVHCEVADILASPVQTACEYAREYGVILLLKGPATIITDGKRVLLTDRGCAGMATAGSGDVLSGIVAATCAVGTDLLCATAAAAYINGRAGELAQEKMGAVSMLAGDTVAMLPQAVLEITVD